jgi:hypothetical protein
MMTQSTPYLAVLTCHPETPSQWVQGIETRVVWTERGSVAVRYSLNGDITRLRFPPPRPPRRADGLWQHTCFEVFIAVKGQPTYYEFNFSPSGEWAAYAFKGYRDGGPIEDDGLHPEIVVRSAANSFELEAIVRLDRLQAIKSQMPLWMGLSAVIEEKDGTLSYWALKHPPGKPDFHHPDSFALELALPEKSA